MEKDQKKHPQEDPLLQGGATVRSSYIRYGLISLNSVTQLSRQSILPIEIIIAKSAKE